MLTQTLFPISLYQNFGKQLAFNPEPFLGSWIALKDIGLFEETARQEESQAPLADLLHRLLVNNAVSRGEIDARIWKASDVHLP